MKRVILIIILFISSRAYSQINIELGDISNHIGDSVMIDAKIYGGKYFENVKDSPTLLNVGADYPDAPLVLVIWNDVRKQFYKQSPEVILKGKNCLIFGKLALYKGKPQIAIHSARQIIEPVKVDVK